MLFWNCLYISFEITKKYPVNKMNNSRHKILTKYAEAHRTNIRKSLEHRLRVAREKGDEALIRLLEAENQRFAH